MKNVSLETKYNELKVIAKELGIKFNGVKAAVLVEAINTKIEELTPKAAPKAKKTLQEVGLKEEQYVKIDGTVLTGRAAKLNGRYAMVKEITGRGFVRVILVNEKNGLLQGCMVRMPVTALTPIETQLMVVA